MNDDTRTLVQYRLARAQEALKEARILEKAQHWNACVNRLYYACFYAVSSLLAKHSLSTSKHSGVRSFFNSNFVKTGLVTKTIARIIMTSLNVGRREITRIFLFLKHQM